MHQLLSLLKHLTTLSDQAQNVISLLSFEMTTIKKVDVDIDSVHDGDHLAWNGGYSMAVFLKSWESIYRRYKQYIGVQELTIESNLTNIYSLTWLYTVQDIKERPYISKSVKDGVYEVCAFLRDELFHSQDMFNGFSGTQYRKTVSLRYRPNRGKHYYQKTRELINFPEIITQTMTLLPADVQVFFILTAVCGARSTQLFRVFQNPLKILRHDDFFRVIAEEAGQGTKFATEYFFPNEFLPMVENFKIFNTGLRRYSATFYNDAVNRVSRQINPSIPCNLSSLRKFCKSVFTKSHIPKASAEYTQGRRPSEIGDRDYDNLSLAAVEDYPSVLPYWKKYVYLPDWMKDGNEVKRRVELAIMGREKYFPDVKAKTRKALISQVKEGVTNAELKKKYRVGSDLITSLARQEGIVRKPGRKRKIV